MKQDDLIYGAHSAIQKGIRRGDLDLVKTSFDIMWGRKEHRSWLKWRTPILVEEEVWYMAGELSKLLKMKTDDPKEWKKFFYKLAIVPKSKDAEPLFLLNRDKLVQHKEIEMADKWFRKLRGPIGPDKVVDGLVEKCFEMRELSNYEKEGIRVFKERVYQGGMYGDRCSLLSGIILIACRGVEETGFNNSKKSSFWRKC